jgi:hypothetical protein
MVHFAYMPSPIPRQVRWNLFAHTFHPLRPSPKPGRVGSCITIFEACSAFTHVTACTLAKSPSDSLHQRLQQSRCLHRCSDCYRVERTSSRAGYSRCGPPPSRRTRFARGGSSLRRLPAPGTIPRGAATDYTAQWFRIISTASTRFHECAFAGRNPAKRGE